MKTCQDPGMYIPGPWQKIAVLKMLDCQSPLEWCTHLRNRLPRQCIHVASCFFLGKWWWSHISRVPRPFGGRGLGTTWVSHILCPESCNTYLGQSSVMLTIRSSTIWVVTASVLPIAPPRDLPEFWPPQPHLHHAEDCPRNYNYVNNPLAIW